MKVSGLGGQASYYAFCGRRRLNTFDGDDAFWHFTQSGGRHSQDSEIGPVWSTSSILRLIIHGNQHFSLCIMVPHLKNNGMTNLCSRI